MLALSYTNAQFRSILNGLGFRSRGPNELNFPISEDESTLNNDRQAVINFQKCFGVPADGIVSLYTQVIAQQTMYVIQYELDLVMQPEPRICPQNSPFYGPQTAQVIAYFHRFYGFEANENLMDDRIADLLVRRKLDALADLPVHHKA